MKNKQSVLISIIIPVYNSENYIVDTIRSCVHQSYENIEIIVINDGSTDNSEKKILEIESEKITYYKIDNRGACAARNYGIRQAKGELIQFLDADDILHKDKLLHQLTKYYQLGDEYVYSATMGTVTDHKKSIDKGYDLYQRDFEPREYFEVLLNQFGKYLITGIWLIPTKLVHQTGWWDENLRFNQDGEYFMRIIIKSKGIVFCSDSIFYYRRSVANSISKTRNRMTYESWLSSYSSYATNFIKHFPETTARTFAWKALSIFYCHAYPNYPDLLSKCLQQITSLGYKYPYAHGGKKFVLTSKIVGVINALRLWNLKNRTRNILHNK